MRRSAAVKNIPLVQRSWMSTEESLFQIEEISRELGLNNGSATIRYCVKQEYDRLKSGQRRTDKEPA